MAQKPAGPKLRPGDLVGLGLGRSVASVGGLGLVGPIVGGLRGQGVSELAPIKEQARATALTVPPCRLSLPIRAEGGKTGTATAQENTPPLVEPTVVLYCVAQINILTKVRSP
jgi:hypothetical protein